MDLWLTPSRTERHAMSWSPLLPENWQSNGTEFMMTAAKTVASMFLVAMPEIDFKDTQLAGK